MSQFEFKGAIYEVGPMEYHRYFGNRRPITTVKKADPVAALPSSPMEVVAWRWRSKGVTQYSPEPPPSQMPVVAIAPLVTEAAASATIKALEAEIERLRAIVAKDPKTLMIAYEDGDHMRLSRAAANERKRAELAGAERDALRKALEGCWCPRPANNRPDHFTVGECVAAGECGCCDGAPLMPHQALSGSKE